MILGKRVLLRPLRDEDWLIIEAWGQNREALWGPFQRFQLDHVPRLRQAYEESSLLRREGGFFLIETCNTHAVIGFVRYTMLAFPDEDSPYPEIGCGIGDLKARSQGYAKEGVELLLGYLFDGYPTERIAAVTDDDNVPAQRMLEGVGFQKEGVLRRVMFRDGQWCDAAVYGILRSEWNPGAEEEAQKVS